MEHYLLFDSGCSTCSKIAHAIEQEIEGPFTVRSLRDPEIQDLLDRANPDWRWEPTWLEVRDDEVRAYTGLAMGLRLVRTLGPRQALRLTKLVNRHSISRAGVGPADPGRRHFLRQAGSVFATIALLIGWPESLLFRKSAAEVFPQQTASNQSLQESVEGEIWEGFLLLDSVDAPRPGFVQCAPAPILCRVDGQYDPALRGETLRFNSIEELVNYIPFPTYMPAALPPNVHFINATVIQFAQSDDIFDATLGFGPTTAGRSLIRIRARPIYPRPYPVRPVHSPISHENDILLPEKVTFTPSPGIMLPSVAGHVLHWIKQDILYTLVAEHSPNREAAEAIARSLVQI